MANLLLDTTNDLVSAVHFSPDNKYIATSSWDGYVHIYRIPPVASIEAQVAETALYCKFFTGCSVLDFCWNLIQPNIIYTANINGYVYKLEISKSDSSEKLPSARIGKQFKAGANKLVFSRRYGVLIVSSWDKSLQIIDALDPNKIMVKTLPEKPFSMDANGIHLVVSMARNLVHIYDLQSPMLALVEERESGLRFQTVEVKVNHETNEEFEIMPNDHLFSGETAPQSKIDFSTFYVQCSYESRIIVDYLGEKYQDNRFAFKCHKLTSSDGVDMISPINSIAWFQHSESKHNLLYTAGSDGIINLWDLNKKKKVKKLKKFGQPVLKLAISGPLEKYNHILAVVTGDDSFKNNRQIDIADKENSAPIQNISNLSCRLYMKLM